MRRTSHEVRGLKFSLMRDIRDVRIRRTSHEVRGLKSYWLADFDVLRISRTSHEVRGLKSHRGDQDLFWDERSHLTRGAWIEIPML